jgi:hypothetical protein
MVFAEELCTMSSIADVCGRAKTGIDTVCKALALDGILGDYLVEKTVV